MKIGPILYGLSTMIPGMRRLRNRDTGGTDSARYCYSVWLRHRVMLYKHGLIHTPKEVAEIGPGDSLGVGLAALISGAENYHAFDEVRYANVDRNIQVLEDLADLFGRREDIPGEDEFPEIWPRLKNYRFPHECIDGRLLDANLRPGNLNRIRAAVRSLSQNENEKKYCVSYAAPWKDDRIVMGSSVDLILSQAVLEHVDDLEAAYRAFYRWLKPGGFMSHVVDFRSHGLSSQWNGHWACSTTLWKCIRGRRSYLINRQPYSVHSVFLKRFDFEQVCAVPARNPSRIGRDKLASEFKRLSEEDLTTSLVYLIAVKRPESPLDPPVEGYRKI